MFWKWILRGAVAVGRSEWARRQAEKLIDRLRQRTEKQIADLSAVAEVTPPEF